MPHIKNYRETNSNVLQTISATCLKNVLAKRYTRCDGESKREYLRMWPIFYTDGHMTLFNMIGCYVTWQTTIGSTNMCLEYNRSIYRHKITYHALAWCLFFVPSINYKFPTRFLHPCWRGFQSRYLSEYWWMVYSPSVDGVFCKRCALIIFMHCRKDKGAFVNKPFINWNKLQEKAKRQRCEGERSASSSRRLHTYSRAYMGQERLSSLALMHIHYQVKIVLDEVVNLFVTKHPRRLELGTILRYYFRSILKVIKD